MSDINKAEELLKEYVRIYSPDRFLAVGDLDMLYFVIQDYFNKPAAIEDTFNSPVEVSVDQDGDVCFDWTRDYNQTSTSTRFIHRDQLVRGLREIGVIQ